MSDIFISYKSEDRPRAKAFARRLEERGFSVWWDRHIPPGKSYDHVIQEALDQASCVVVLWSELSVRSDWVKEEASAGLQRGILMPVLIDDVPIPLGFGRIQTANLVGWQEDASHPEFLQLCYSIRQMVDGVDKTSVLVQDMMRDPAWRSDDSFSTRVSAPVRASARKPATAKLGRSSATLPRPGRVGRVRRAAIMAALATAMGTAGFFVAQTDLVDRVPKELEREAENTPPLKVDLVEPGGEQPVAAESEPGTSSEPPRNEAPPVTGQPPPTAEPPTTVQPPPEQTPAATAPAGTVPATGDDGAERALEGYHQLLALQERFEDPTGDAAELLRDYETLWSTWRGSLDADSAGRVLRAIESLEADVASAEAAAALEERGDLTVFERLAHWRELAAAGGRRGALATARVTELEEIVASSATILGADRFVTCNGVRRADGVPAGPAGVRDDFRPGQVHVFAWVNAPRPQETLTLEWVAGDGTVTHSQKVSVGHNTATGYRIFYNKGHAADGRYEVRLYNEAGTLIGRRAFTVS